MNKITVSVELSEFLPGEMTPLYKELVDKAKEAIKGSYSPYSNYPVGAAVLLSDNTIILGSNQENAAYPSGLCAERTALFYSSSQYPLEKIKAIAVTVARPSEEYPFPCGSCLQVISEYQSKQNHPIDIILIHPDKEGVLLAKGVENLLPFAFKKQHLSNT